MFPIKTNYDPIAGSPIKPPFQMVVPSDYLPIFFPSKRIWDKQWE
jgi:hypothetical protein